MKLLLILSIATLAMCQEAYEVHKGEETNDVPQGTTILQRQVEPGSQSGDKKLDKRSHGWDSHGWGGWSHGWPICLFHRCSRHRHRSYSIGWSHGHGHGHGHGWGDGWGGHGWYGGLYSGWPWWYGSHGWHGGHGGWHSKW